MLSLILNWLSGSVLGQIESAYKDYLAAQNAEQKLIVQDRLNTLNALAQADANVRAVRIATAGHWEQRFLFLLLGLGPTLHAFFIYVGTTFAAPLGWHWLDWTLHIPPAPAPFDAYEGQIIGFFFGSVAVVSVGKAIAGAIGLRKS